MTTRDVKFQAGIKVGMIMTKCLIANDLNKVHTPFSEITTIISVNHIKCMLMKRPKAKAKGLRANL